MAILRDRQDKAIAINLLGRKVLTFDATRASSWYCNSENPEYSGTITEYPSKDHDICRVHGKKDGYFWDAKLYRVTSTRPNDRSKFGQDDYFYLMSGCCCLDNSDGWQKYVDFANIAKSQLIESEDKVSILVYDRTTNLTEVHCVIAKDVGYKGYSTCGYFVEEPIEDIAPQIARVLRK